MTTTAGRTWTAERMLARLREAGVDVGADKPLEAVALVTLIAGTVIDLVESGRRDLRMSTLRRYAHAVGASVRHVVTSRLQGETAEASEPTEA